MPLLIRSNNPSRMLPARFSLCSIAVLLAAIWVGGAGCGTGSEGKKKDSFFTSGSREADQRASQRMARDQQLAGTGDETGKAKRKREESEAKAGRGEPAAVRAEDKVTLYDRLGGENGIAAIVDDFTPRVLADPRVNWARQGVSRSRFSFGRSRPMTWQATPRNIAIVKEHMGQFLALASGGPPRYEGKEMKAVHAGMRITNPEFDAAVGDLKASLDRLQIPDREQKELLAIIESTRPQIVTVR